LSGWVESRIQCADPTTFSLLVGHDRNDEQVTSTCSGDVEKSLTFRFFAFALELFVIEQLPWGSTRESYRKEALIRIDVSGRRDTERAGYVAKDDERKLESFGSMNRHEANPLNAFFDDRLLRGLTFLSECFQVFYEASK
jgi:hypothetical protein